MANSQTKSISQEQFLLVSVNLLHRAFVNCTRADAKQRFRLMEAGQTVALPTVELEDKSRARFAVTLDMSEYRGRLNFSAFRTSLETLIGNMAESFKEKRQLSTFTSQDGRNTTVYGITGATVQRGQANVMMMGSDPVTEGDLMVLRLMYLDPAQFVQESQQEQQS